MGLAARAFAFRLPFHARTALSRPRRHLGPSAPTFPGTQWPVQARSIVSSYAARDHSMALANVRNAPATDPPNRMWLDEFQCFQDGTSYRRHGRDADALGHVRASFVARRAHHDWRTRSVDITSEGITRPLLIFYNRDFTPDDGEFWLEASVLRDFATAIAECQLDDNQRFRPSGEMMHLETIHVHSRFHYCPREPNEPWHTSVFVGCRRTRAKNYLHGYFHVYAKNEKLEDGYGGYCQAKARDDANAAYLMPAVLYPDRPTTEDGFVINTHNHMGVEYHARILAALQNKTSTPEANALYAGGRLLDHRVVTIVNDIRRKSTEMIAQKKAAGASTSSAPVDLTHPDGPSRGLPKSTLEERIQHALCTGDLAVMDWALKFRNTGVVNTVDGGSRRLRSEARGWTSRQNQKFASNHDRQLQRWRHRADPAPPQLVHTPDVSAVATSAQSNPHQSRTSMPSMVRNLLRDRGPVQPNLAARVAARKYHETKARRREHA